MTGHGQFCSAARALDAVGGRWSLLIVREMLGGACRFGEIRRGIPRISRTVLSERLDTLEAAGVCTRVEGAQGPQYELTSAGQDLASLVAGLATWGQRWLPRKASDEDLDLDPVLLDMQRRTRLRALPPEPFVIRFELGGHAPRFMLMKRSEAAACTNNPGFPELLAVHGPLHALAGWWRGDLSFAEARRTGLLLVGDRDLVHAFPGWFDLYAFADVPPARPQL
jgi:DNA-binding HxlR family transcriptional regulator